MTGRHAINRDVALSALNSPAGRSVAAAMAVGTMLGVALPSANADEGSANADLVPVTDLSADETITDTSAVKAPADANWQLEQVQVQDAQASDQQPATAFQVSVQKKATPVAAQPAAAQQAGRTQKAAGSQESGNVQGNIQQANATITRGARPAAANNVRQQQAAAPVAQAAPVARTASGSGSSVLSTAMSYVGSPYRWGGTTPSGWDCIGFVRYVYGKFGVSIGGYTTSVLSAGTRVPYSQAQPGDILYWPGHVGIYAGNGQNVGAWNPSMGTRVGPNSWVGGTPTVIRVLH